MATATCWSPGCYLQLRVGSAPQVACPHLPLSMPPIPPPPTHWGSELSFCEGFVEELCNQVGGCAGHRAWQRALRCSLWRKAHIACIPPLVCSLWARPCSAAAPTHAYPCPHPQASLQQLSHNIHASVRRRLGMLPLRHVASEFAALMRQASGKEGKEGGRGSAAASP